MPADSIRVHNARQHNLKSITVEIPRRSLTVITGPSGSGKSSLAFDTLYAEGQRRYVESLSTYARQFLERMPKPAVDRMDGVSPAVAIEQKNPTTSSRSTVGTATEIYDYLRLLWARVGQPFCHRCGAPISIDSPSTAVDRVLAEYSGQTVVLAFPVPRSGDTSHELLVENLQAMGFVRVLVDGRLLRIDELPNSIRLDVDEALVVVDRIKVTGTQRGRIADSIATAFAEGEGMALVVGESGNVRFSQYPDCAECGAAALQLTPSLFSFNNPRGACPGCNGFGAVLEYDESLIIPDANGTLTEGAIDPWTKPRYVARRRLLRELARQKGIPIDVPWHQLKAAHKRLLLHGTSGRFHGVFPFLRRLEGKRYKQYIRVFLRRYQKALRCPACGGARLRPEALAVKIAGSTIAEIASLTAQEIADWMASLDLSPHDAEVAGTILRELKARVEFLCQVGLSYLNLNRQTRTLSSGEAQRISLSNALGSNLVDTLYVLDEPSIGLHARDIGRLLRLLRKLTETGNTVVVVEHDPVTIREADHMIELGPGSGEQGGHVVYSGPLAEADQADTLTGKYLRGEKRIAVPSARRVAGPHWLTVKGATLHNLRGLDTRIPLGTLTVVTGVSGSGKSTLVHDVIYRHLAARLKGAHGAKEHLGEEVGRVEALEGWQYLTDAVLIDQSPIGRSPRSNPVTYVRAFDQIRALFAAQPLARARGYTPTTFSFNASNGGRCRSCEGAGHVRVEMVFMADIFAPCEECGGTRYEREVLDVRIKGLSIQDALNLTVSEAINRFRHQERLGRVLWHLQQVGMGYIRLGQPATTLSGGEAQRLKIARHLAGAAKKKAGRRLYILDEPTTGLHLDDLRTLMRVLDRLVDAGNTVLLIEHNLDVIKRADWIIDMGPEGGEAGGEVVASGTPEEVIQSGTYTGNYLKAVLPAYDESLHPEHHPPGLRAPAGGARTA